ncbi:hypothetical protein DTL70_25490 [Streptomyces diacarni]|uniref:Uncharacterized protein n=1 Tax=Streptomyces diacarni TaxID=2800381 RepID=A0A367ELU8_9ACTN|nr:hypothetical protein DTL70_25490 [Streptomyces diacarni]
MARRQAGPAAASAGAPGPLPDANPPAPGAQDPTGQGAHQPLPDPYAGRQSAPALSATGAAGPLPPEHHDPSQPMPPPQPAAAQPQPYAQPQPQPHAQQQPYAQPQPQPFGRPPHGQPGWPPPQAEQDRTGQARSAEAAAGAADPARGPRGARPRTGSPIIAPGFRPAAVTTVLAALLAAAAPLGHGALAGAVVLLQAVTAAGWYRLNGMWPARQGIALAFVAGLTADVGLLVTDGLGRHPDGGSGNAPAVLLAAAGVWCLLSLVLQLRNNSSPDERLYAVTMGFAATGLTVLAAGLIPTEPEAVTVGAAAVAGAALLRAVPLPWPASVLLASAAAAGVAAALSTLSQLDGVEPVTAALLGLGAGVCALVGLRVASYDWPSRFVHMTAGVALPLTLATPALYLLGRTLL